MLSLIFMKKLAYQVRRLEFYVLAYSNIFRFSCPFHQGRMPLEYIIKFFIEELNSYGEVIKNYRSPSCCGIAIKLSQYIAFVSFAQQ
jgi:hypothetical protein